MRCDGVSVWVSLRFAREAVGYWVLLGDGDTDTVGRLSCGDRDEDCGRVQAAVALAVRHKVLT